MTDAGRRAVHGLPDHPRFRELSLLGTGSMGVVYRAYDTALRQHVALKTLSRHDPEQIYWLKTEFRSLADVRHRNLVELYELVVDDNHCFFTMELLAGVDLGAFIERVTDPAIVHDCVRQLIEGVRAIHSAGKLHRDLKPANVFVTRNQRVVVLDFGLSVPLRAGAGAGSATGEVTGTFAYMSPEQARGEPLTAKSDWYSVGVVLYEVLTGRLPLRGIPLTRQNQERQSTLALRLRAAGAPERLASLVAALLDPDPGARPGVADILGRLETEPSPVAVAPVPPEVFVGRVEELHRLRQSYERAKTGAFSVDVLGESGIGKTALLERFTTDLKVDESALVLRGRCHPHESVPYKALDGVLDGLTNHLLERENGAALPTADIGALLQLFPVLGRVSAFAACSAAAPAGDPVEMRRRGAGALRTLLAGLSADAPVVAWIDDLQWGDSDSASLLRAILGDPHPPRVLLLLSYRSEDLETSQLLKELSGAPLERDPDRRITVRLSPLSSGEARTVARRLLPDADRDEVADIAREAGGSPFLISQLVLHRAARGAGPGRVAPRLGDVLFERLATLDRPSRRILDVVCLAAAPLSPEAALEAAGLDLGARSCISMMRSECLLRLDPQGEYGAVQPYHDRIRESVVARVEPTELRAHHRALAQVLRTQPGCDPEALFTHYLGAGDTTSALPHVEKAAARAAEALAFDRATRLYGTAIDLTPPGKDRTELLIRHGEALTNSRRTLEAGERFMEVADLLATREPGSKRVSALRRRAAESFLRGGRYDEGGRVLRGVLEATGVKLPRSDRQALIRALLIGLPYKIGDIRRHLRRGKAPSPEAANRLDVLWGANVSLTMTDFPLAVFLGAKFLREAFRTNDTDALVRALAYEAMLDGSIGGSYFQRRSQQLLAVADRLAGHGTDPWTTAYMASGRGSCAWADGRWRAVLEHYGQAQELLLAQSRRQGRAFELAVVQLYLLSALSFLGDMRTLSLRLEAALQDAMERGDLFAADHYRVGQQTFCRLAADEPERVLELAAEVRASMPANTFHIQRYHLVTITTQCHLYLREPWRAWETIDEAWPGLKQAQFLRLVFPRTELLHLRARAALAMAEWLRSGAGAAARGRGGWTPRALVRHAARLARRIRRARTLPARPFAAMIDAGVAASRGDVATARAQLEDAIDGFRVAEMLLYREAARVRLGRMVGGERGSALVSAALGRLAEQAKRPEAVVWTLAPGFGEGGDGSGAGPGPAV